MVTSFTSQLNPWHSERHKLLNTLSVIDFATVPLSVSRTSNASFQRSVYAHTRPLHTDIVCRGAPVQHQHDARSRDERRRFSTPHHRLDRTYSTARHSHAQHGGPRRPFNFEQRPSGLRQGLARTSDTLWPAEYYENCQYVSVCGCLSSA